MARRRRSRHRGRRGCRAPTVRAVPLRAESAEGRLEDAGELRGPRLRIVEGEHGPHTVGAGGPGSSPARRVIAQRPCLPSVDSGAPRRSSRSRYAMRAKSTPSAAARPCHSQSRGLTSMSLKRPSRGSLELDLRHAVELEGAEQAQGGIHGLLHPHSLTHTACAHARWRLAKLAAAEQAEDGAVGGDVAPHRVQLVVSSRDELLHHRLEGLRVRERPLELGRRLTAEGLAVKVFLKPSGFEGLTRSG